MKIAVIGAGIHGICTAYELVSQGHRVEVFERNGSAAEEASFANGSLLSAYALSSLLDQVSVGAVLGSKFKSSPVLQWQGLSPSLLRWAWQTHRLRHSPLGASRRRDLQNLAQWSQSHLLAVCNAFRQDIDQSEGVLLLMRSAQDQQRWAGLLHEIVESGLENSVLNREQTQTIEPALREDTPLHQAVWLAQDGSANCRQFGLLLKSRAEEMGVVFHFNTEVQPLVKQQALRSIRTSSGDVHNFDAVVVCAGEQAMRLIQPMGVRFSTQRIHGYSISAAVREPLDAPKSVVYDTRHHVSIARLGQRVRVAGAYSVGKHNATSDQRVALLYKVLDDWFPGAARAHENPQIWHAAVCSTCDGLPVIGRTPVDGLWLNTAHGLTGWTLACGSARGLADQMSGRQSAIDLDKFGLHRFHK